MQQSAKRATQRAAKQARETERQRQQELQKQRVEEENKRRWAAGLRWALSVNDKKEKWNEADKWYEAACKKGFRDGCDARIEAWSQRGKFMESRSLTEASEWYVKACQAGRKEACDATWAVGLRWALSVNYQKEQWDNVDTWFENACKKGFRRGCNARLGAWYRRGKHLLATNEEAAKGLFQKSCQGGLQLACLAAQRAAQPPSAGARRTFYAGGAGFAMRWIPAGRFWMGSPSDEAGRSNDEDPQGLVHISKGFWMLESEVTQGQYKALMGSNPSLFSSCGNHCPVEQVSWGDAREFADKLSAAQGLSACTDTDRDIFGCKGWRLPTEAEWEYAARAGTTTPFHTGGCISTNQANYDGNNPQEGCAKGEFREKTIAVCSLAWNQWGLCDMHGNVSEWTMDVYGGYAETGTRDPLRTDAGTNRVYRGGGWIFNARYVRSAVRFSYAPTDRSSSLGFRLIKY